MTDTTVNDEFTLKHAMEAEAKTLQVEALLTQVNCLLKEIEQNTHADLPFTEIEEAQGAIVAVGDDFKEAINAYCQGAES